MNNNKYMDELLEIALNDSEPDDIIIDDISDKLKEISSSSKIAIAISNIIGLDETRSSSFVVNKVIECITKELHHGKSN